MKTYNLLISRDVDGCPDEPLLSEIVQVQDGVTTKEVFNYVRNMYLGFVVEVEEITDIQILDIPTAD